MQLAFSRDELLSEHDYHRPHLIRDRAFHGGFDANDGYVSPRSKLRTNAIRNWGRALRARGGELHPIDFELNHVKPYPNAAQSRHLFAAGNNDLLWNFLTGFGRAEARGRDLIAALEVPDFDAILTEDCRDWALGTWAMDSSRPMHSTRVAHPPGRSEPTTKCGTWFAILRWAKPRIRFRRDRRPAQNTYRPDGFRRSPKPLNASFASSWDS